MSWDYRVLAKEYGFQIYFQVHEVYYDKDGVPNGYTANPIIIGGESLEAIKWTSYRIKEATKKPILWEGYKFPNEYITKH